MGKKLFSLFDKNREDVYGPDGELITDFTPPVHEKPIWARNFIKNHIEACFLFNFVCVDAMEDFVNAFECYSGSWGTTLITQGKKCDYFYLIQAGSVQFIVNGEKEGSVGPNSCFGELSLLYDTPRAATCMLKEDSILWRIDRETYCRIIVSHQSRQERNNAQLLKKVLILQHLSDFELQKFSTFLNESEVKYSVNDRIIEKGTIESSFYIIKEGTVIVTDIGLGDSVYDDLVLSPGDFFGERGALEGHARAANVTATSDCTLFVITVTDVFNTLGYYHKLVREMLQKAGNKHLLMGVPIFCKEMEVTEIEKLASVLREVIFEKDEIIYEIDQKTSPQLYFIISGKVKCISATGEIMIFSKNDYFGKETFEERKVKVISKYSFIALEETMCDVLSLASFQIFGYSRMKEIIGIDLTQKSYQKKLENFEKSGYLGAGQYGHINMVKDKTNENKLYALKIQSKCLLLKNSHYKHIFREKNLCSTLDHPFILRCLYSFQDDKCLYMILTYCEGGDLYNVIHRKYYKEEIGNKREKCAKFYAACIIEALKYMHQSGVIYRDLKPENILLHADGYPVIGDLGFAKATTGKSFTFCGTPLYIAPEVVLRKGYDQSADIWSFGIVIYEFIHGYTPFRVKDQGKLFRMICEGEFQYDNRVISKEGRVFLNKLINLCPSRRLGCIATSYGNISSEKWIRKISIPQLLRREIKAPVIPRPEKTISFRKDKGENDPPLTPEEQELYRDF